MEKQWYHAPSSSKSLKQGRGNIKSYHLTSLLFRFRILVTLKEPPLLFQARQPELPIPTPIAISDPFQQALANHPIPQANILLPPQPRTIPLLKVPTDVLHPLFPRAGPFERHLPSARLLAPAEATLARLRRLADLDPASLPERLEAGLPPLPLRP